MVFTESKLPEPTMPKRTDRTVWISGIVVAVIALLVIVIVRGMFSGLGGLKEGIATARRQCVNEEELSRRATVAYLLRARREVRLARSRLTESPDELNEPNISLGLAEIELDRARSMAECVPSDTTLPEQIRRLTRRVNLTRGEMVIDAQVAVRWLDQVRTELDDLVRAIVPPDTTVQGTGNAELGTRN